MKVKYITTTSDIRHPGYEELMRSLMHFGYDSVTIMHPWMGFGDKVLKTYEYLKENPQVEHFVYTDAWDTFALAPMSEIIEKVKDWDCLLFGAEKACYPHDDLAPKYPACDTDWKYLNGGNWLGASKRFIEMVERQGTVQAENDQVYFTRQILENNVGGYIKLDYKCEVFQTIGFEHPGDFSYADGRLINNITGEKPVFAHGNGRTPMNHIYDLLKR